MRSMSRRSLSLALAPALMAGAIVLTTASSTSAVTVSSCYLSGNTPFESGTPIKGRANRAGCGDLVLLKSYIKKDLSFQPDPAVGYGEKRVVNGYVYGEGPCSRGGHGTYYVAARTDTGQAKDGPHRSDLC